MLFCTVCIWGSGKLGPVQIFSTGMVVAVESASDSFVKHSSLRLVGCGSTISHSLLTHLAGVCVCVWLCVYCPHIFVAAHILHSAWLVPWFCYYTLPTDKDTHFKMHAPTSLRKTPRTEHRLNGHWAVKVDNCWRGCVHYSYVHYACIGVFLLYCLNWIGIMIC